jgi:Fur family peroxide stress response transcriptional regulator
VDLQAVQRRFDAAGLALTPQRRAIVEHLSGALDHPTAAQIHSAVKGDRVRSLATVYNTLALLQGLQLVCELPQAGGESRYDPNTRPHHHLLCGCGALLDVPSDAVTVQVHAPGLRASSATVTFLGTCPDCA